MRSSRRDYQRWRATTSGPEAAHKPGEQPGQTPGQASGQTPGQPGSGKPALPRSRSFAGLFSAFWGLLRGHRRTLLAALATLTVATAVGLYPPLATKLVFDYVLIEPGQTPAAAANPATGEAATPAPAATTNPSPAPAQRNPSTLADKVGAVIPPAGDWLREIAPSRLSLLVVLCLSVLVTTAVQIAFGMWGRWQCTRLVKRVQVSLRRRLFEHAARLPLHRVQEIKSGGVASILREDAGGVGDLIFSLVYNPFRAVVQLIGTLVILAFIDWRMLVGSLVLLPVVWVSHRTWIARIRPMFRDVRRTRQGIDAQAAEAFGGMRVVRGFGREQAEAARFTVRGHLMVRQEIRAWWWSRALEIVWQVLIPLATAGVLLYFGAGVLNGERTAGDLIAFLLYLGWLLGPLESLVSSATSVQNQLAGLDRVLELDAEPEEFSGTAPTLSPTPASVQGRVTLDAVSFAYPKPRRSARKKGEALDADPAADSTPSGSVAAPEANRANLVLHDISLDVAPGETIALVGPSGSGKTTLCNLIARFYDPTQGRVLLDGDDLADIRPDAYRRLLGIVEQDVFLFDGTIAENIAYGRRRATIQDVTAAAEAANAHGFINALEHGYDTLVGERGVRLSGGQKQRIAIARAVLAAPRVLILDEATSNLDSESELLIQRSLARLMQGRTSFVIAHRLSTIRHADRIVVLEHGRINEIGTHDELIAAGGRYAELVRLQTQRDEQPFDDGQNGPSQGEGPDPYAQRGTGLLD